ncbi:MAG: DUF4129 domain-containing protein, partial [Dehalococcoidia bacterium]
GVLVLGAAWLRASLSVIRWRLTYTAVLRSFSLGLGIIVVGLLVGRGAVSSRAIDRAALPFFVMGLLTLALVHLGQAEHIHGDSWRGPWLRVMAVTTGLLALLGVVAGLLPLGLLNALLAPVGALALLILDVAIYIIAVPIALLLSWVLVHLIPGSRHQVQQNPAQATESAKQIVRQAHQSGLAAVISFLGRLAVIVLVAYAVYLLLRWAYSRLQRPQADGEDEERESVESEGNLRTDLSALLDNLRNRFRRAPEPIEPTLPPRILAVRRLYLSLLGRAAAIGVQRPAAETANEFAPVLRDHFNTPKAESLSRRFSSARYGLLEPTPEELQALESELRQIRELDRRDTAPESHP